MTGAEKWIVGAFMFGGTFIILVILRAVWDAFRDP